MTPTIPLPNLRQRSQQNATFSQESLEMLDETVRYQTLSTIQTVIIAWLLHDRSLDVNTLTSRFSKEAKGEAKREFKLSRTWFRI